MAELTISSDEIRSAIANYTSSYSPEASREEVGVVISAADGIAQVSGLPSVMANELLEFPRYGSHRRRSSAPPCSSCSRLFLPALLSSN